MTWSLRYKNYFKRLKRNMLKFYQLMSEIAMISFLFLCDFLIATNYSKCHLYHQKLNVITKWCYLIVLGSTITCLAAIAWKTNSSLSLEKVQVEPPKAGEVRIKVNLNLWTCTCEGKCREILFHVSSCSQCSSTPTTDTETASPYPCLYAFWLNSRQSSNTVAMVPEMFHFYDQYKWTESIHKQENLGY